MPEKEKFIPPPEAAIAEQNPAPDETVENKKSNVIEKAWDMLNDSQQQTLVDNVFAEQKDFAQSADAPGFGDERERGIAKLMHRGIYENEKIIKTQAERVYGAYFEKAPAQFIEKLEQKIEKIENEVIRLKKILETNAAFDATKVAQITKTIRHMEDHALPWLKEILEQKKSNETLPPKPEFLSDQAWEAIYQSGLNYLETEAASLDTNQTKEKTGYFFIDPLNPHLTAELKNLAVNQDNILAELDTQIKTAGLPPVKLETLRREIERQKRETSWDNDGNGVRKILNKVLSDAIRQNEKLSVGDKLVLKDLLQTPNMQYPTEVEARAILEKIKASEPDRAVAMYARGADGQALKVFFNKTNKKIDSSRTIPRSMRPDYGKDTKFISVIGNRVSPKKLSELTQK